MYTWQWNIIWRYKDAFLQGALVTIELTLLAIVAGTFLGIIIALLRRSSIELLRIAAGIWIQVLRSIPVMILLVWTYYVLPILTGLRLDSFSAAVVALSLSLSGFVAETIRAGIASIPRGQFESGSALGMSPRQVMITIIAPQAIRTMLPNLLGLYIIEIKNSSLTSVIAVNELLHRGNIVISASYRPLEIYTTVGAIYLLMILPLSALSKWAERRSSRGIVLTPTAA